MKTPKENQSIKDKLILAMGVINTVKNFQLYFLDYFKMVKKKFIVYKLKNGLKFKVRSKTCDRNLINEIFINNDYTKYFNIEKGDTVVDIGANIGLFSVLAAKRVADGKVYSFEPFSENLQLLNDNIKLNNLSNVTSIKKAVTKKKEKKELFIESSNFGGNSLYEDHWRKDNNIKKEEIETTTLKDFIKEHKIEKIDFLKVDCEGSEYEILVNCDKKILSKIKKMSIEFHNFKDESKTLELIGFLRKNGFSIKTRDMGYPIGMIWAVNKKSNQEGH